jgi:aminoglycoside phosphotransferase (APT) family kinase protein
VSSQGLTPEQMRARLEAFVAEQEGVARGAVEVVGLRRLAGGASRLLWALEVSIDGEHPLELVLRQDPPGRIHDGGMALEFELLRAAADNGVPVPRVYWCCPDQEVLGSPFFAMQRIEGEAIGRRLLRDAHYASARATMTSELGSILARIHRIDPTTPALKGRLAEPSQAAVPSVVEIDRIAQGYRELALEPHPVLDLAERWLRERAPRPDRLCVVHGDYRIGNVMFDARGTRAILDWELAHVGDPVEDLGWLCVRAWRYGGERPVGGIGTREELLAAYEAEAGRAVDPEALRFWEACGNYKLALVFITQARAFLDGAHATVELASLGRRTVEAEDELLHLMDAGTRR